MGSRLLGQLVAALLVRVVGLVLAVYVATQAAHEIRDTFAPIVAAFPQ